MTNDELIARLREEADNTDHHPSARYLFAEAVDRIFSLTTEVYELNEEISDLHLAVDS